MVKSQLSKALRILASALEALEQHDLESLLAGKGKLVYVAHERAAPNLRTARPPDLQATLDRLGTCKDREEARSVLSDITNKDLLTSLAKAMKIHVMKHDRREDIENKIIEFAIGGKLRSEAIQTLNMKGGSDQSGDGS